jgi:hypothetical protein
VNNILRIIENIRSAPTFQAYIEKVSFAPAGTVRIPCDRNDPDWEITVQTLRNFCEYSCRQKWHMKLPINKSYAELDFESLEDAAIFRLFHY